MWDLGKAGASKYGVFRPGFRVIIRCQQIIPERRSKDHIRSINKLSASNIVPYCITGSADGDLRVWV
jgi:hypothetical protein